MPHFTKQERAEFVRDFRTVDLKKSGLNDPKVIRKLGIKQALDVDETLEATGYKDAFSYAIPYYDIGGKPLNHYRWKLNYLEDSKKERPKYHQLK
jgi:hypothetical protein